MSATLTYGGFNFSTVGPNPLLTVNKEVVKSDSERLPAGSSIQCFGKTKKGSRCKKKTLNADGYCHIHRSQKK